MQIRLKFHGVAKVMMNWRLCRCPVSRPRVHDLFRPRIGRSILYLLATLLFVAQAEEDGFDGKVLPEKGDPKCPSLAERYDVFKNGGDSSIWLNPCKESLDSAPLPDIPDNGFVLQIFASLPAYIWDLRTIFSWAIVGFLNEASFEYNVKLNYSLGFFNSTDFRPDPGFEAEVVLQHVAAETIENLEASWWWQYRLVFHCFVGNIDKRNAGQPLTDKIKLRKVEQNLNQYLRQGVETVSVFEFRELSYGLLGLSVEDPRYSPTPFKDGPPTMPPTLTPTITPYSFPTRSPTDETRSQDGFDFPIPDPTYMLPIDAHVWDWRRYLGLSIFLGTCMGTLLLTQMAAFRRRQRTAKEIWGNLGSIQGVDALLNTGWKVKGSKMEVFDKEGLGYRDDDSMLIGGFEQSAFVGAEITVTQDSKSATTPDTSYW